VSEELLRISLCAAVPMWVERVRLQGWDYRLQRARECAQVLASDGDKILYATPAKRGKDGTRTRGTAEAFNHLAEGLACLAFCPGGVTFLGEHFEVKDNTEPMSSTNRGGQRSAADRYSSPPWVVRRLMEHCELLRHAEGPWIEPGAGFGGIINTVQEYRPDIPWAAVELLDDCLPALSALRSSRIICPQNYLHWYPQGEHTIVLGNPPYRLAEEFIRHSFKVASRAVFMLLSMNFLGSEKRVPFFEEHLPHVIYQLPNRPSFDERGSDSVIYGWYCWLLQEPKPDHIRLERLASTPIEERKRWTQEQATKAA